jgi:hypothetical protein
LRGAKLQKVFVPWQLGLIGIVGGGGFGLVIGFVTATLLLRSRMTPGAAFAGALLGSVGFLSGMFLAGWASMHEAFENGRRLDLSPSGEDLWLRNRIVEHEFAICVALGVLLPLLCLLVRSKIVRCSVPDPHM